MSVTLSVVRFLHSGWCSQFARLAGVHSWKWIRFYAVFAYFEHPIHGGCLIDTGYSQEFFAATRGFPERVYRWLTPVQLDSSRSAHEQLSAHGIDPASIRRIFISHFHADHVAGLKCFPNVELVYRWQSLDRSLREPVRTQVRHGFLRNLIPNDLDQRSIRLQEDQFSPGQGIWDQFQVCDYWNDGSLLLVDLPGHADGHLGFVLNGPDRPVFYIVDACWHIDVLMNGGRLPWISRNFQWHPGEYFKTQQKLRSLAEKSGMELLACHCPRTLKHVG